jgi:hypothetical protein
VCSSHSPSRKKFLPPKSSVAGSAARQEHYNRTQDLHYDGIEKDRSKLGIVGIDACRPVVLLVVVTVPYVSNNHQYKKRTKKSLPTQTTVICGLGAFVVYLVVDGGYGCRRCGVGGVSAMED